MRAFFYFNIKSEFVAYFIDKEGSIVKTITKTYQDYTGDLESELRIGKGGTYAGKIPRALATGMVSIDRSLFPDYIVDGYGEGHQPDEALPIKDFFEGMKLFATILLRIDEEL